MNKNIILGVVVVIIVGFGFVYFSKDTSHTESMENMEETVMDDKETVMDDSDTITDDGDTMMDDGDEMMDEKI